MSNAVLEPSVTETLQLAGAMRRYMDLAYEGYTIGYEETESLEAAGLVVWRKVKRSDLDEPFAADRGIEKGGMLCELTTKGRAFWAAMQAAFQKASATTPSTRDG